MHKIASYLRKRASFDHQWLIDLNIPKRKPKAVPKDDHTLLTKALAHAYEINRLKKERFSEEELNFQKLLFDGKMKNVRLSKDKIEQAYSGGQAKPNVVKTGLATYIKFDSLSYDKFLNNIDTVEKVIKSLKGFHAKATRGIKVKFVSPQEMKSKGKYKTSEDTLWVNAAKAFDKSEAYASLAYIIVHELGHRFLRHYSQKWNYDAEEWATTKYSKTDSFTGEEKFAELFALSHWPSKYGQFADQIKRFKQMVK